jgi:hypothetical protein
MICAEDELGLEKVMTNYGLEHYHGTAAAQVLK